jgi:hypothetical protein
MNARRCWGALALWLVPGVAVADTDPRDYESWFKPSSGTITAFAYARDRSTSDVPDLSEFVGVFRANWMLAFGNGRLVLLDAFLPVADARVYTPSFVHASGIGDLTYRPGFAQFFPMGDDDHAYVAISPYVTFPTGMYDPTRTLNIGAHRWSVKGQLAAGLRFWRVFTLDAVLHATLHTGNDAFVLAQGSGTTTVTMQEDATLGAEAHAMVDLSPTFALGASYYATRWGQESFDGTSVPPVPARFVQTLRFTWAIQFSQLTQLLLQFNEDITASGGAPITRFVGARLSHAFF